MLSLINVFKTETNAGFHDPSYYMVAEWLEGLKPNSVNYLLTPPRWGRSAMLKALRTWNGVGRTSLFAHYPHPDTTPLTNRALGTNPPLVLVDDAALLTIDAAELIRHLVKTDATVVLAGCGEVTTCYDNVGMVGLAKQYEPSDWLVLPALTRRDVPYFSSQPSMMYDSCAPSRFPVSYYEKVKRGLGPTQFDEIYQHKAFMKHIHA